MTLEEFKRRFKFDLIPQELLGEGKDSKVYKGFDKDKKRAVAIKVQRSDAIYSLKEEVKKIHELPDSEFIARYESDAKGQVCCYTFQKEGEKKEDYAVMKLHEEGNLSTYLKNNPFLTEDQKIDLVKKILLGMQFLHQKGILHHNLKPSNILIDVHKDGHVIPKISDFGISRKAEKNALIPASELEQRISDDRLPYCSPEQVTGEQNFQQNSDLWSVGAIIGEIFTGKQMFRADHLEGSDKRMEIIRRVMTGEYLGQSWTLIPSKVAMVIEKCLIVNPIDRLENTEECIKILEKREPNEETTIFSVILNFLHSFLIKPVITHVRKLSYVVIVILIAAFSWINSDFILKNFFSSDNAGGQNKSDKTGTSETPEMPESKLPSFTNPTIVIDPTPQVYSKETNKESENDTPKTKVMPTNPLRFICVNLIQLGDTTIINLNKINKNTNIFFAKKGEKSNCFDEYTIAKKGKSYEITTKNDSTFNAISIDKILNKIQILTGTQY